MPITNYNFRHTERNYTQEACMIQLLVNKNYKKQFYWMPEVMKVILLSLRWNLMLCNTKRKILVIKNKYELLGYTLNRLETQIQVLII